MSFGDGAGAPASGDELTERIAGGGREVLIAQLHDDYRDTAEAYADVVTIEPRELEELALAASNQADAVQWRRALATVAAGELGIGLPQALTHRSVVDAQGLLGVPSYEELLRQLALEYPQPEVAPEPQPGSEPIGGETRQPDFETPTESHDVAPSLEPVQPAEPLQPSEQANTPEPAPEFAQAPAPAFDEAAPVAASPPAPAAAPAQPEEDDSPGWEHSPPVELSSSALVAASERELVVGAVHLGGVADLPPGEEGLTLRVSADGLDIRDRGADIIGRLQWGEIVSLDVPQGRGLFKRNRDRAQLRVRTKGGDASFEVPQLSAAELREQVEPLVERFQR